MITEETKSRKRLVIESIINSIIVIKYNIDIIMIMHAKQNKTKQNKTKAIITMFNSM